MKLAVLGAGAWGTAIALSAADRHAVTLCGRDPIQMGAMRATRVNERYLSNLRLPVSLSLSSDFDEAVSSCDLLVIATPVAGLRATCEALAASYRGPLVWLCKGFEEESLSLPHQVVAQVLPGVAGAVLSGPSFAQEVALGLPTALTVASRNPELNAMVVEVFHSGALRVYHSEDVVGVEVGGAVKNVLAIATGISDGLKLGLNARAALITRGLSEMTRLGDGLGGQAETLMGLTGLGDLILTCTGGLSRNRSVGEALGRGQDLPTILVELGHVAEGVRCARGVQSLARRLNIDVPIIDAVCSVMFENVLPRTAVATLLHRAPRAE